MQKIKQEIISPKVVKLAKFIQQCDKNKSQPIIIQSRRTGLTEAIRLARNNN